MKTMMVLVFTSAALYAQPDPRLRVGTEKEFPHSLVAQRGHAVRLLHAYESLASVSDKALIGKVLCHSMIPVLPGVTIADVMNYQGYTVEDLEALYSTVRHSSQATPREEIQQQYLLQALLGRLSNAYSNEASCQMWYSGGMWPLPTKAEISQAAAKVRSRIAEIDRQIAKKK